MVVDNNKIISIDLLRKNNDANLRNYNLNDCYAAIDLGSNSFHLSIASFDNQTLKIIDVYKHKIQLAAGLDDNNFLSQQTIEKAVHTLEFYSDKIKDIPHDNISVLATFTLRKAKNAADFLNKAKNVFIYPIEIISGIEEARIIYQGVANFEKNSQKLLVIDIGGGSTELVIGKRNHASLLGSLNIGCVSFTSKYFANEKISKSSFDKAITASQLELQKLVDNYQREDWEQVIGTSGTIESILIMLKERGLIENSINFEGLLRLKEEFISCGDFEHLKLCSKNENRRNIIVSGLAILIGIFKTFSILSMRYSKAALREGMLYELNTRGSLDDIREKAIDDLRIKFQLDMNQSQRVDKTSKALFDMAKSSLTLDLKKWRQLLRWSSKLHEVGMAINFNKHHQHGEYIINAIELSGFNLINKTNLSIVIGALCRKFPQHKFADILDSKERSGLIQIAKLLRLSVLLNHRRNDDVVLPETLQIETQIYQGQMRDCMTLNFPKGYLETDPLLVADLELEKYYLELEGYHLKFI